VLLVLVGPADALLITVVFDRNEGGHAVLTATTDQGDLVLDNLTDSVLPWQATGLRWKTVQSADPSKWFAV
jgi:predicted transglutaminase-like cysteine proteinase